jgi:hypothetical protein
MKRESGHWNRAARRGGGDRRVVLGSRTATTDLDHLRVLMGAMIDSHPDWPLEQVANEALKLPGANVELVSKVLEDYLDED